MRDHVIAFGPGASAFAAFQMLRQTRDIDKIRRKPGCHNLHGSWNDRAVDQAVRAVILAAAPIDETGYS
jgi:hypothetical protein